MDKCLGTHSAADLVHLTETRMKSCLGDWKAFLMDDRLGKHWGWLGLSDGNVEGTLMRRLEGLSIGAMLETFEGTEEGFTDMLGKFEGTEDGTIEDEGTSEVLIEGLA
eukprot:scaffold8947_cov297-Chaetoceros_neogracile.AAC.1